MDAFTTLSLASSLLLIAGATSAGAHYPERNLAESVIPSELSVERVSIPSGDKAMYPDIAVSADNDLYASWLEPIEENGHRLMVSRWSGDQFDEAAEVARGNNWFVNWADYPTIHAGPDGKLVVHWLERLGESTYAYGVRISQSNDHGEDWSEPVWLHDDRTLNEHGFVSMAAMDDGSFWAVWLDSRNMARTGNMALWARRIQPDGTLGPEAELDDRVCSCCQTATTQMDGRVIVSYRDRTEDDTRDISVVTWTKQDGWKEPSDIANDGWVIFT